MGTTCVASGATGRTTSTVALGALLILSLAINRSLYPVAPTATRKETSSNDGLVPPPEGQIPLERLPSNTLLKYTAYKDVSILHFRIPTDTRTAFFSFKAYEESKGAFQRNCKPNDITLHLKAGSYPVISPENITFPKHFLDADERCFSLLSFLVSSWHTRAQNHGFYKWAAHGGEEGSPSPLSGVNCFISRQNYADAAGRLGNAGEANGSERKTTADGWHFGKVIRLAASCETLLMSEMSIVAAKPKMLNTDVRHQATLTGDQSEPSSFKFFVPANVSIVTWRLHIAQPCSNCTDVTFHVQASALPTPRDYLQNAIICPNQTGDISIDFYPHESTWHYVDLDFLREPASTQATQTNGGNETTGRNSTAEALKMELPYTVELIFHPLDETMGVDAPGTQDDVMVETSPPPTSSSSSPSSSSKETKSLPNRNFDRYSVLRQTYREFFMFDYDLLPDVNGTVPVTLNLTAGVPALMKFDVNDVYDIGGTLSFAVAMRQDLKGSLIDARHESTNEHAGVVAEKLVDMQEEFVAQIIRSGAIPTVAPPKANQTVIVCLRLEEPGIPTWPDKCVYGRHIYPAAIVINNTDADTNTGLVHVPFPEPGAWYVTLGLFCHQGVPGSAQGVTETTARTAIIDSVKEFVRTYRGTLAGMRPPCACAERIAYYRRCVADEVCLAALNETETLKLKECIMDAKCTGGQRQSEEMARKFELHHKHATEQSVQSASVERSTTGGTCNASVVFTISSSPCVAGRCGRFGRCYHYMSGGFVFSTCLCLRNYRGWDCTEDSQVPSSASILLASLMLTLSNLLFLPSIFFAVRRGYHSEAIIYFFAMFFSAFYHACDSGEEEFSFCLVKIGVLQFCDFYCGLLAIWVTLIAMANVRHQFVSLLHMLGAILLAFGTELNKQSLWVFLAPALTGICLISVSWGMRCRKTRRCFPARSYLALYLPVGSVLVMVGLVCFAFLQTKQNYHIVHSIWHMVMALSILCLLPDRKTFHPKC
ncbi:AGAP002672-PA-like protein [Anopheles sinensis]|uniref:AGAP002672-PA-like protein n=1 Tax=Anopheles sinensis TaxID=74873 RepID=A0A084W702_ANOSI|nr:AGAP002672-PA-like protein [Anopheles sinensis]